MIILFINKWSHYNTALATTGAIRNSSMEKRYKESISESLQQSDGIRNFTVLSNQLKINHLSICSLNIANIRAYRSRNIGNSPRLIVKHTFLKNSCFPSTVIQKNNLGKSISKFVMSFLIKMVKYISKKSYLYI